MTDIPSLHLGGNYLAVQTEGNSRRHKAADTAFDPAEQSRSRTAARLAVPDSRLADSGYMHSAPLPSACWVDLPPSRSPQDYLSSEPL